MYWFWCIWGHSGLYSMKKPPKKSLRRRVVWPTGCVPRLQAAGATGDCDTLAVRALSPRGAFEEDSCSQTSDQAILYKRNISLMLVLWHLELSGFLHHTVLFKNVIYQRKRQGCPDNLILSWLLELYWREALLNGEPVSTRSNSSQHPSSPLPVC